MTKDEVGVLIAERQFRGTEERVQISITPPLPLFTLRRGTALQLDPANLPSAELLAVGFTADVALRAKTWRVEGFSWSFEVDGKGGLSLSNGAIVAEEIVP
jgi:hypothetical protein